MAESAAVSAPKIAHVLQVIPDYGRYDQPELAGELETEYRVALGRIFKHWGDQLLDLAEEQSRPLSRNQAGKIDSLLDGIGEIFRALNAIGTICPEDSVESDAIRECDAKLLSLLERAHILVYELRQREFSSVWLEQNAKPLYRTFRRLEKVLTRRSELLGIPMPGPEEPGLVDPSVLGERA